MKGKIEVFLFIVTLILSSFAYAADFSKGAEAYNKRAFREALQEFKPLALQGDILSQFILGEMYEYGRGVVQDHAEAVHWYKLSSDQGNAFAQQALGNMYLFGKGVEQSYAEAARWYIAASEQGNKIAQHNIGVMYFNGQGVLQNYVLAHMWLNIAASQGYAQAIEARSTVAKKMTPTQIEEAQKLAQEWMNSR